MNNYDVEREITRMTENRKLPMNERIEKLAEQARKKPLGNSWCYTDPAEFEQKFAELIITECLNQCYFRGMNDELYAGQLRAAAYIEQHFGVEESKG